jgi:hypothetical protein
MVNPDRPSDIVPFVFQTNVAAKPGYAFNQNNQLFTYRPGTGKVTPLSEREYVFGKTHKNSMKRNP